MASFPALVGALNRRGVRFVLIGVWGANFHALDAAALFTTLDYDLFLPPSPENLLEAWRACDEIGLSLQAGGEPLDTPRDRALAAVVIRGRASVRATGPDGFTVDLTLVMTAFEFEAVWDERRVFLVDGEELPVARLSHIIRSKAATNRPKDRLFLATHAEALRQMLDSDEE